VTLVVNAVSFAFSAVMTSRVRVSEHPPSSGAETLVRRAREGFGYLWRHAYLAPSLRCCTTLNFFSFVAAALVLLFASRNLGLSAGMIGLALGPLARRNPDPQHESDRGPAALHGVSGKVRIGVGAGPRGSRVEPEGIP